MKANELRIGVLVWLKSKQAYYQIESGHDIEEIVDAEELSDAEPIPLTEEILIKIGFECEYKSDFHSLYFKDGISYYFWYDKAKRHYASIQGYEIKCDYLHILQNVTFTLTGEELNITNLLP